MRTARRTALVLAGLVGVTALAGCRPGTALHGRYNDLRAYYNTYYNATRKLEEGELALQRDDAPVDRRALVAVFPTGSASGGAAGPFQEAVDKSAELLRNRPDSRWADDALLVIGKAYFYQRNLAGAEQKFRETMTAASRTDSRRLGDEARFWLGRTLAESERFDEGVSVLEAGLAMGGGDRRWTSRMQLALGELYARAGRWDEAAATLAAGAEAVGDADLAARAFLLLGQVEEHAGRFEEAAGAYGRALGLRPAYELAFAAEVSRALVLGLDADRPDDALAAVARMRGDDKHYERRAELALVQARLLAADGQTGAARALFHDVLYDDGLDGRAVRGEAHYRMGEFARDALGDFVRASAHFDTAATALAAPDAAVRPARAGVGDVAGEAQTYGGLAAVARRVAEADSLLALGALSDDAFRQRVEEIEAERLRVYLREQRALEAERTAQAFAGGGVAPGADPSAAAPGLPGAPVAPAVSSAEAGFLGYRDPASVQAGIIAFGQRWGDRPLVPNWRRLAEIQAGPVASTVGGVGRVSQATGIPLGQGPPRLDLSQVPRTPAKRDELVAELAGLRYELANAFFLSVGRADTAAALYQTILDETPDLPVAVRARYALAEIELAAGRDEAARPLYESVLEAEPDGPLAEAVRLRLGRVAAARTDEAEATSAAYEAARERWRAGAPREAAAALLALADAAPDAPGAARAYLAAAAAYTDAVLPDSAALAAPLPPDLVSRVFFPEAAGAARAEAPRDSLTARTDAGAAGSTRAESVLPERATPAPGAAPDSARAGVGPVPGGAADSLAVTLRDHLEAVAERYAGTPFAERAEGLAAALPAPRPAAVVVDSATTALAAAHSVAAGARGPAATEGALFGTAPIQPEAGGVSWRFRTMASPEDGQAMLRAVTAEGYRTAVAYDEAAGMYLLLVGQFETEEAGEATRTELPAWAQVRAELVPVDDLVVGVEE